MSFHPARRAAAAGGGGGGGGKAHNNAVSFDPTLGLEDARAVRDAAPARTHAQTRKRRFWSALACARGSLARAARMRPRGACIPTVHCLGCVPARDPWRNALRRERSACARTRPPFPVFVRWPPLRQQLTAAAALVRPAQAALREVSRLLSGPDEVARLDAIRCVARASAAFIAVCRSFACTPALT
jgi:hypothetical protein